MNPAADTAATCGTPAGVVDLNERNWLPRHARGEAGAFDELLNAYRVLVLTLLVRWGVEAQHRDDLFQEIFLKVHQAADRYRPSEPLRPWLVSIVLNTVRNHRRDSGRLRHAMNQLQTGAVDRSGKRQADEARKITRMGPAADGPGPISEKDSGHVAGEPALAGAAPDTHAPMHGASPRGPDEQAERQATAAWLERRIAKLPERQREVLVLATVKSLSMKQIATLTRQPENTVKTHLRRARLALAEALAERESPAATAGGEPA